MSAPDFSRGIAELADLINFHVGAWHDFGYETPPTPDCKPVPPLGERSTGAVKAAHEAIQAIDQLTRQLYALRSQLVGELRQDSDVRAARIDAMLARRREEPQPDLVRWQCPYCETEFVPSGEPVVCPVCGPLHGPGARYVQPVPRLRILGPLPWHLDDDGARWKAELPDGRTAVIRRVIEADGTGTTLFVPTVYESALDFVTGPECSGVLAAAQWVAEHAAVSR